MHDQESSPMNQIRYDVHPEMFPDNDMGNLRLFYELEMLKSYYEGTECSTCLERYIKIIDTLGSRGHYVNFSSDLKIDKATNETDWEIILKPIPSPKAGEDRATFISRCIKALHGEDKERSKEQIAGICYDKWRGKQPLIRLI